MVTLLKNMLKFSKMNNAQELIYQSLCYSKTHLALQPGCQQVVASTVEVAGIGAAETAKIKSHMTAFTNLFFWM